MVPIYIYTLLNIVSRLIDIESVLNFGQHYWLMTKCMFAYIRGRWPNIVDAICNLYGPRWTCGSVCNLDNNLHFSRGIAITMTISITFYYVWFSAFCPRWFFDFFGIFDVRTSDVFKKFRSLSHLPSTHTISFWISFPFSKWMIMININKFISHNWCNNYISFSQMICLLSHIHCKGIKSI